MTHRYLGLHAEWQQYPEAEVLLVDEAWISSILTSYFTRWPLFLELFYERNFQRSGEVTLIRLIVLQRNQYSEAGKDTEVLIAI